MLFRPHAEKYLLGVKLPFTPGLIPKRRRILAEKTAKTISNHLLTDETLVNHLCSADVKRQAEAALEKLLEEAPGATEAAAVQISDFALKLICSDFFLDSIKPLAVSIIRRNIKGLASLFVTPESIYDKLYGDFVNYLNDPANHETTAQTLISFYDAAEGKNADGFKSSIMSRYDNVVRSGLPSVLTAIDLSSVIESKINDFEMQEAEDIITSVVDRELKAITYLGGLLGFIIGLAPPVLQSLGVS